jgi:hypothetical protein
MMAFSRMISLPSRLPMLLAVRAFALAADVARAKANVNG